jgi:hypothetical protein
MNAPQEQANFIHFGPPQVLQSLYNDPSPKTALESLQNQGNIIFTTLSVNENNCVKIISSKSDVGTNTDEIMHSDKSTTVDKLKNQQGKNRKCTPKIFSRKKISLKSEHNCTYKLRHRIIKSENSSESKDSK